MSDDKTKPKDEPKDLPQKDLDPNQAENVKGGAIRRTGDDDDLSDLEVQR